MKTRCVVVGLAVACLLSTGEVRAAPKKAAAASKLKVQIRVYNTPGKRADRKKKAEKWVLQAAQAQYIEGKTANPIAALEYTTGWITLTRDTARVMDSPTHGKLDARVRPAREPDTFEVLAKILSDKARTALYVRVPMKAGAQTVSRIISGFDRPDVYIAVQVKP